MNDLVLSKAKQDVSKEWKDDGQREHICLCLDHSGSMSMSMTGTLQTRLHTLAEAVGAIIGVSSPEATLFSMVAFESKATLVYDKSDNFLALCARAWLSPAGGTNMLDGLSLALQQAPKRVILLSDGEPSNPEGVLGMADTAAALGIKIDTVSIGESGDSLMQEIAKRSGGVWRRCETPAQLAQHFMQLESRNYLRIEHNTGAAGPLSASKGAIAL
jgi:uncharacterized protein with von Willebrand factor type A (vWA) domain